MSPKRNGKAPASKTTRCGQLLQARYSYRLEEPLGREAFGTVFRASVESKGGSFSISNGAEDSRRNGQPLVGARGLVRGQVESALAFPRAAF
jgi:hypothetical protein